MSQHSEMEFLMRFEAKNLLCSAMEGLPADLVPCIVARDNNVGDYAVPSLRGAMTARLPKECR